MAGLRILVVASFDSFLRAGSAYADLLGRCGEVTTSHVVVAARPVQISREQFRALGFQRPVPVRTMDAVVTRAHLERFDVVISALDGLRTRRFMTRFRTLWDGAARRPLVLSLYPGLVFRFHLEGMVSRLSSDLFLLNSRQDHALYSSLVESLGLENNGVCAGLSFLPGRASQPEEQPTGGRDVVFVGQPTVPAGLAERRYVIDRMLGLARRFPSTPFVIKPRHRRGETTLHQMRHHFEDLLDERGDRPANLSVSYEPMAAVLDRTAVCLTFSSTAAVEALGRGIPTRILTDLGIHENLGNHFFLGSGLFCDFDQVTPELDFVLERAWYDDNVTSAADTVGQVRGRIDELLSRQRDAGAALPVAGERLFGRAPAFTAFVERELGWQELERFGDVSTAMARVKKVWNPIKRIALSVTRRI